MSIQNRDLPRISVIKNADACRLSGTSSLPLDFLQDVSSSLSFESQTPHRITDIDRHSIEHHEHTSAATKQESAAVTEALLAARVDHDLATSKLAQSHAAQLAELRGQHTTAIRELAIDLTTAIEGAEKAVHDFFAAAQPALIDLSVTIADTLTGMPHGAQTGSLRRESDVDVIKASVSWAIEELSRDQSIDIYLNPDTLQSLDDNVQLESLNHGARLRWHARPELAPEDWVAASPQTTLRRVRKEIIRRITTIVTESLASAGSLPIKDAVESGSPHDTHDTSESGTSVDVTPHEIARAPQESADAIDQEAAEFPENRPGTTTAENEHTDPESD